MSDPFADKIPFFREDFERVKRELIRTHESILFIAQCSFPRSFGYIALTSERLIGVAFQNYDTGFLAPRRDQVGFGRYDPTSLPNSPLTSEGIKTRRVFEVPLRNVLNVTRDDVDATIYSRKTTVVRLRLTILGESPYKESPSQNLFFFDMQDGKTAYDFLGTAGTQGSGSGFQQSSSGTDIPVLLEALDKLHRSGILTDQEFESKKRELLSRI